MLQDSFFVFFEKKKLRISLVHSWYLFVCLVSWPLFILHSFPNLFFFGCLFFSLSFSFVGSCIGISVFVQSVGCSELVLPFVSSLPLFFMEKTHIAFLYVAYGSLLPICCLSLFYFSHSVLQIIQSHFHKHTPQIVLLLVRCVYAFFPFILLFTVVTRQDSLFDSFLNADAFSGIMFQWKTQILSFIFIFIPNWNSCIVCIHRMECENATNFITEFGKMRKKTVQTNRENNYTFENYHYYLRIRRMKEHAHTQNESKLNKNIHWKFSSDVRCEAVGSGIDCAAILRTHQFNKQPIK